MLITLILIGLIFYFYKYKSNKKIVRYLGITLSFQIALSLLIGFILPVSGMSWFYSEKEPDHETIMLTDIEYEDTFKDQDIYIKTVTDKDNNVYKITNANKYGVTVEDYDNSGYVGKLTIDKYCYGLKNGLLKQLLLLPNTRNFEVYNVCIYFVMPER